MYGKRIGTDGKKINKKPGDPALFRRWHRLAAEKRARRNQGKAAGGVAVLAAGSLAEGLIEYTHLGNEHLKVVVLAKASTTWVHAMLEQNGTVVSLNNQQQLELLRHWYRHSRHVFGTGDLPVWLQ